MVTPGPVLPLDKLITGEIPTFASPEEVEAFEQTPYDERIAAKSTYEAIQIGANLNPSAPAIEFLPNADADEDPIAINHGDFVANVTRAANLFTSLGVGKDDVVSMLTPLVPQSFFALFGAEAAGIANPVNPLLEPHQLAEILKAAKTKVLVALGPVDGADIWEKVETIREDLPDLAAVIQIPGPAGASPGELNFNEELANHPGDHLVSGRSIEPDDVAAYFHTGGTTGTPKLVPHTHANQVYQAWALGLMMQGKAEDKLLFGLPLFHVGGALTQGLNMLARGASMVVLSASGWRNANAIKNCWRLVHRYRPSTFGGVPTVLAAAAAVPVENADLSSLQSSSGGGSAIPVAVCEALERIARQPVIEVYGMTETSSVHTLSFVSRPIRVGSVGHAVPYSKVRVVKLDTNGNFQSDCEPNEIGVVTMAGPGVFSGYLNDEHNVGAFVEPGWVNSGDLGRLDEEGYLWITGRAKDLIIRGGHNIDPAGVEETLYEHDAVGVAALVGQPDGYAGELPLAYVQLKPGASAEPHELLAHIREKTPERAAVPVDVILVDEMPLTGVGKVFKPKLRWDAAQRVFQATVESLELDGCQASISVGAHGTHGSLATVTVRGSSEASRGLITERLEEALGPFTIQHEVVFD